MGLRDRGATETLEGDLIEQAMLARSRCCGKRDRCGASACTWPTKWTIAQTYLRDVFMPTLPDCTHDGSGPGASTHEFPEAGQLDRRRPRRQPLCDVGSLESALGAHRRHGAAGLPGPGSTCSARELSISTEIGRCPRRSARLGRTRAAKSTKLAVDEPHCRAIGGMYARVAATFAGTHRPPAAPTSAAQGRALPANPRRCARISSSSAHALNEQGAKIDVDVAARWVA